MKVVFISSLYATKEISGAEKIVRLLAEGIARRGHTAVVICLSPDGEERSFDLNGVAVHQVRQGNIYSPWPGQERGGLSKAVWHGLDTFSPRMVRKVGALLDRERPDIVHSHLLVGFTLAPWFTARRRKLPLVHTMHDWYLMCPNSAMFRGNQACETQCTTCAVYRWPHLRCSSLVDAPVGPSDFYLQGHLKAGYFARSRLPRVVHNCYEGAIGPVAGRAPGQRLRLGFIGRLSPAKGIELLLETFRTLRREKDCELIVGGSGDAHFDKHLHAAYADTGAQFLGKTTPAEFFPKIDLLVVPSLWHEAFPLVMLEAYGHGIPVVASRRGGNIEMIEEGRNGYLFEPNRPEELPGILARLIDDPSPLAAMQDVCLATARRYSKDNMVERYLSVYGEAAGLRQ